MTSELTRWQERIHGIKRELLELGDMRPGALSEQYNVCGKPNCCCKAARKPKKHGPYYQISYSHHGKSTTEHVPRERVEEVQQQLANYARFKELVDEWVTISLQLAKLRR